VASSSKFDQLRLTRGSEAAGHATDIAGPWRQALATVGNSAVSPSWTRELISELTSVITDAAARSDELRPVGVRVARELVTAHFTHPETIAVTIEVMQQLLPEYVTPADRVGLFAGLAEGYAHALCEYVYDEQQRIHQALNTAHRIRQARFQTAFGQVAVGILIADGSGRIIEANHAIAKILGLGAEQLQTTNLRDLPGLRTLANDDEKFKGLLAGRSTRYQADHRLRVAPDGEPVHVRIRVDALPEAEDAGLLIVTVEEVSELHALNQKLLDQATRDPLTGLPNRVGLLAELSAAYRTTPGRRIGACFLNLDDFASVNDTLGHQAGDQLLVEVATRLAATTDPHRHVLAHTGPDEFVILVRDCDDPTDLIYLAQDALAAVREPVEIDGLRLHVTAHAGLVGHRHGNRADPDEVMRAGTAALSWAKADGHPRWALFEPRRHARISLNRTLRHELPSAVERGELFLEYQPIVDLISGRVHRMEALVRWNHPSRGTLSPGQFIPLAEESDTIVALGRWVLERAVADAAGWPAGPDGRRAEVSVNLAARQLQDPRLCHDIQKALAAAGLPAELLHLEVTESEIVKPGQHGDPAVGALHTLADLGIGIAIDDFGTGYSCMAYLHRLPARVLKIDQSFVSALAPADKPEAGAVEAIIAGMITMAHACGMTVTAEGVQTRFQALRLRALGADTAQGFLLSRPVPNNQVPALLATPAVF
jgi:diguanylate cyclase (GGDEF)-like protein/PAS domain S-box-containing protein